MCRVVEKRIGMMLSFKLVVEVVIELEADIQDRSAGLCSINSQCYGYRSSSTSWNVCTGTVAGENRPNQLELVTSVGRSWCRLVSCAQQRRAAHWDSASQQYLRGPHHSDMQ